jgi:hypothetical protein
MLRQVLLLQVLAAVVQQVGRDDLGMQAPAQTRGVDARRLFHDHHREALVHPGAAVLLGHRRAEEARRAGLGPDLAVDMALLFPARVVRRDLLLHEAACGIAERGVVFVEKGARNRQHGFPRSSESRRCYQA